MHASISFSLSALLALSTLPNPSDARSWSLKPWARGRDHSKFINERKVIGTRTVTVKATRTKTIWVGAETSTTVAAEEGTSSSTGSMVDTILPTTTQASTEQTSSSASSASTESVSGSSTIWQTESVEVTGTASFSSWASEAAVTASTSVSPSTTADDDEETSSTTQTSEASATGTASSSASAELPATESSSSVATEIASPAPTSTDDEESSTTEAIPTTSEVESSTETAGLASTTLPPNLVLNPTSTSANLSELTSSVPTSNTASSSVALPEPTELASTVRQESQIFTMPLASGIDSFSGPSQSTVSSTESEAASSSTAVSSSSLAYQPGWNAPGAIPSYPPFVSASQSSVAEATATASSVPTNSSTAATSPSQSAYVPNGQAPGAIPAYPSFAGSSSSSVAQASMTESLSTDSGSAASSATSSVYTPNGQAPGAIPAYPSFMSSSRSSDVQASQTDTSAIASATSSDAAATQTQSQSTETAFESATQSASTASSWWSSWFSASSAASETASASTTVASETVSVSATATETATISTSASSAEVASASSSSSTSAPIPVATGRTGLSTTPLADKMTAGYYPDWTVWTYPVSALDWSKLDVVDFAFAIPDVNFQLQFLQYNSLDTLRELVSAGHAAGKKVRLSIGGWTGSVYFSAAVSNDQNRQTFANNIATVYSDYNLDGIDLDWEYPGGGGAWGNGQDPNDTTNYLKFFQVLRKTLPPQALISSATQVTPFRDASGAPSTDISGFAQVLDWITIMNYDIWSSSNDNPGPNAPLSLGCGKSDMDWANAEAAVTAWGRAGMPSNQIMLGIAAYGYLQMSSASRLRTRRRDLDARAMVTVKNPNGDSGQGQINFASLVDQGALKRDPATGNWVGDNGFTREWDECSSTPWLKSPYSGQLITYDDPQSISMKAQYARQAGLRGTSVWEITGDMGGSNWSLLTAARSGLGI